MSVFSDLIGFKLESYDLIFSSATRVLTSTGLTNVIDVTEAGVLIFVAGGVTQALNSSGGNVTAVLEIEVDGGSTRTIEWYTAASIYSMNGVGQFSYRTASEGVATSDGFGMPMGAVRYKTSLRVGINVTTQIGTAGTARIMCLRGKVL